MNVIEELDVALPELTSRRAGRVGDLHRPTIERRARPPMTTEQPDDAPAPSGLFRDVMATFGSVGFPMPCRPAVDEDEDVSLDSDGS